ncbi:ATP-binding protein [Pseudogemmatithrix spongiicola]|uniref:histidine kinase n=1 Tax=Pseudogemmatithrix spongiicola TaxID=3062599 RepID=A0AA49Q4X5_9BACT|nr:ATP-binding protein [Gemmatimonadaceae bacterium 'strain 138']WKW15174.1 ATP-binding protein [Gemmatimonadaceae bacterium 'strain 318']
MPDAARQQVSELQHLTEALQRERERLVTAQAVAKVGSWETDLQTLSVLWSDETYRIFGVDPGTYVPTHVSFLSFVHPDDRARVDEAFRASFATRDVCTVEHRVVAGDGSTKIVEERWQTFVDGLGHPIRAAGTCQDLTERRRLEAQHLRTQRLESLGTLAGGIAHDLNNVLTPILATVDLLREEDDPAEREHLLTTVEESARRGAEMVRQVLAFARGSGGEHVPVDLRRVVDDARRVLVETLPKDISVRIEEPAAVSRVLGDATMLYQVLMNLCVNARDAMAHGGQLSIALADETLDEVYAGMHPQARPGRYVRVTVADTGTGIPPAVQERMFEPFFTTKELGQGTGLGLSTVHAIVRGMGGFVNVYSEIGRGARFVVYLPAITGPVDALDATGRAAPLPRGRGELVLVVDDEPLIREVVTPTLERNGYTVRSAANGAEGVAAFVEARRDLRLVLTDMAMPVLDGPSMIRAIRAMDAQVPIIGTSGLTGSMVAASRTTCVSTGGCRSRISPRCCFARSATPSTLPNRRRRAAARLSGRSPWAGRR